MKAHLCVIAPIYAATQNTRYAEQTIHTGRDSRRVVVTPPRPRAKCSGFYAPLKTPPNRATAGLAGGKSVHENHAFSCGVMQF